MMNEDKYSNEDISDDGAVISPENIINESGGEAEILPIKPPLQVLKYKTIDKKFGWWAAVVLLQSYARKQICFYLWQQKGDGWKRKQKFGIHSVEDWKRITTAVDEYITELT